VVKAIDPICTWCNKPDSKCTCETGASFQEPPPKPAKKLPPGVDVSTYLMEFLGLVMFYLGFIMFTFVIAVSFAGAKNSDAPVAVGAIGSFIGFFSTFGIMLSGSIMYLLARINHRLWST